LRNYSAPLPSATHENMHEMSPTNWTPWRKKSSAVAGGKWRFDKIIASCLSTKLLAASIPREFIAPDRSGIREALDNEFLRAFRMV